MTAFELAGWEEDGNKHVSLRRTAPRAHHVVLAELVERYCPDGGSVLDFGCGIGQLTEQIAGRIPRARLTAADPYQACLDATVERVPTVKAVLVPEDSVDVTALDDRFDVVVVAHVLEHTTNQLEAVRCLVSAVAPGGVCVLAVPNPARPKVLWYGLRRKDYANRGHVVAWDPSHWRNFLENIAGLDVIEYLGDEVQILPPRLVNRVGLLRRFQRRLARTIPWWSFSNIAVVRVPADG